MREYSVVPPFSSSKIFYVAVVVYQFITIGLIVLGHYFTPISYFAAVISQSCVFYFLCLFLCARNYRLHINLDRVTVWTLFNKPKQYISCQIRWKIKRIPWYNTYFIVLYSNSRTPIAIIKPHWENATKLLRFSHYGRLTIVEHEYIVFLKKVGLLTF